MVRRALPRWPGHALAREHAARAPGAGRSSPGTRARSNCRAMSFCPTKWWRLMTPAKPLPMVMPCTSTVWPTLNSSHADLAADLELAELFRLGAEFLQHVAGFHRRLGEVPGERLVDAARAALAERDLHRGVAVLVRGLDLRDPVVGDIEHRHRLVSPSSVKMRIMPTLRPTSPIVIHFLYLVDPRLRGDAGCCWPALHLVQAVLLNLDLHVDAGRQIELHERVHRLVGRVDDVHQPQMRADLELLARGLVDVRRAQQVEALPCASAAAPGRARRRRCAWPYRRSRAPTGRSAGSRTP